MHNIYSKTQIQIFVFPLQQGGSRYWIILIIYKIGYNRTSGQPKGNTLERFKIT